LKGYKLARGYSSEDAHLLERELCTIFPSEWLREKARATGLIKRERKIDPVTIFWVLAISYGTFLQRTLATLKRNYETASNKSLSDSSWYYRFTPELVAFLRACVSRGLEYLARDPGRTLNERLSAFQDVLIQDSTIIRLHEKLAKIWPAARSRKAAAGVKLGVLTSAIINGPKSVSLYAETTNDLKLFKELKSKYALDVVPTSNPQIIEAFIWIAVLTLLISRRIHTIIRRLNPGVKVVRFTHLRWATIFSEKAGFLLTNILDYLGIKHTFETSLNVYSSEALDPHVNRKRFTEEWWA